MSEDVRRCAICGKRVTGKRIKYCSDECAKEGERQMAKARGGVKVHPAPYHWIVCKDCGKEVYVHIRSMRCPDCQSRATYNNNAKYRAMAKAGTNRMLGSTDFCERCGKPYVVNGSLQKYCRTCAPIALKHASNVASAKWNKSHYNTEEAIEAKNARQRAIRPYKLTCAVCGATFEANDLKVKCCSEACTAKYKDDYHRAYREAHKEEIKRKQKAKYDAMRKDPEKVAECNRKARENYAKRKAKKKEEQSSEVQ